MISGQDQTGKKWTRTMKTENPMARYGTPVVTYSGVILTGNVWNISYTEWLPVVAERYGLEPRPSAN